ncbi:MAG: DUF2752 domain-containing protein [Planctomycetota bacterium]|nr:MAG: DUF2752 domain-containing protein [Planctomycetota bacterium]
MTRALGLWGAAVLVAAFAMDVRADGRVAFAAAPQWPLPELCVLRRCLGRSCPTCGLTRSVIAAAHGRWHESLRYHVLGIPLTIAITVATMSSLASLARALANRPAASTSSPRPPGSPSAETVAGTASAAVPPRPRDQGQN